MLFLHHGCFFVHFTSERPRFSAIILLFDVCKVRRMRFAHCFSRKTVFVILLQYCYYFVRESTRVVGVKEGSLMEDVRGTVFRSIHSEEFSACIISDMDGICSGVQNALQKAAELGLSIDYCVKEGCMVYAGEPLMHFCGNPAQLAEAEDTLIGLLAKTSGIATAAKRFTDIAGESMRIICGSWKKMPACFKVDARKAVVTGGAHCRITDEPMVYLDKNYVEMLGGIQAALFSSEVFRDRKKVIQIRGRYENGDIIREAVTAIHAGADILYVDTGNIDDAAAVVHAVKPLLSEWERDYHYRKVEIAFGGGVTLKDIPVLRELGIDIVGVGRAIIDAPLLDMRMEITGRKTSGHTEHHYSLLDKSELLISDIELQGGNLTRLAAIVAEELGIDADDVLVIDVRDHSVALDILQKQLDPKVFIGKEQAILTRLSQIDGITIGSGAHITSRGMLGWIAADEGEAAEMLSDLERGQRSMDRMATLMAKRAVVFPSGPEVESGEIEDTNTPLLISKLSAAGFTADAGEVLKDDLDLFTGKLRRAMDSAYGVIITTGGVGAENKDYSVEAILRLDPSAAAPYIVKFKVGEGRHRKNGIRIAVGQVGYTTLVALPGPNDEVALCADCLIEGLSQGWSKELLAGKLAQLLRSRLMEKMGKHHSHNE